jgi:hypothetical protein
MVPQIELAVLETEVHSSAGILIDDRVESVGARVIGPTGSDLFYHCLSLALFGVSVPIACIVDDAKASVLVKSDCFAVIGADIGILE